MTEIIEAIDDFTSSRYSYNMKLYGFCELVRKTAGEGSTEQIMPVTIPAVVGANREKVSVDDVYNFITWTRWATPVTYEANEEWSFGKDEARVGTVQLRLILAHKTSLGEDIVLDFVNALPTQFEISGYQFVFVVGTPSVDPDHEAIWQTEFGSTSYEKHRFIWNLYAVNITVQFLQCEILTP